MPGNKSGQSQSEPDVYLQLKNIGKTSEILPSHTHTHQLKPAERQTGNKFVATDNLICEQAENRKIKGKHVYDHKANANVEETADFMLGEPSNQNKDFEGRNSPGLASES